MLEFLFKLDLILPIRAVQEREWGSSGASNAAVQLEHTTILFKSELCFTTTGSSRVLTKAVQVRYLRQFRWAYEGSTSGGMR
jgi:hypothetical protein